MTKLILILLFTSAYSQEKSRHDYQVEEYSQISNYLKSGDTMRAAYSARFAVSWDENTAIATEAKKIYEQLLPICQRKIKRNMRGNWSLFKTGSNWGYTAIFGDKIDKILIIDDEHFYFYDVDTETKKKNLTRKEQIIFTDFENSFGFKLDFVFSDGSIWSIRIDEKNEVLKQSNTGKEIGDSRTEIVCGNQEFHYLRK